MARAQAWPLPAAETDSPPSAALEDKLDTSGRAAIAADDPQQPNEPECPVLAHRVIVLRAKIVGLRAQGESCGLGVVAVPTAVDIDPIAHR